MVTINFTLLVETGLFLLFMWAMHRYVFTPLLAVMDERADGIAADKHVASSASEEAIQIEIDQARRLSEIHHEATQRVVRMHHKIHQHHLEEVEAFKRTAQAELVAVRREAKGEIEEQRKHYGDQTGGIAGAISRQLGLEHAS